MRIAILPTPEDIAVVAADRIQSLLERKPSAVLGLATGSTPLPLYDELTKRYEAGEISFANTQSFNLDEYVGLPEDHPEGYANFIHRFLVDRVDFPKGAAHGPNVWTGDNDQAAADYDKAIRDAGGIDLQILGIGADGHIGFNEPGGSFALRTHVDVLTEQTRRDNARFFDGDITKVPTHCITQGLGTIMESGEALLIATGAGKAEAVRQLVEGAISARWPATILQMHPNAIVLLDEPAAQGLELADFYREVWAKHQA